ncbi:ion channel [Geosporobacter ferrireducens]|uniref:ion channel n=1 Tax=Geosporobacter ferrireducens TaxID=1424294 RepID=UPI003AB9B1C9
MSIAYFAIITFFTVGYGDIIPNDTFGQILVSFTSVIGGLFIIVGAAGILSIKDDN